MTHQLIDNLKRLSAIAEIGRLYSPGERENERYREIEQIAESMLTLISRNRGKKLMQVKALRDSKYPTPKVEVRAYILRGDTVLLVKERQDNLWALPGGWAEIGSSASESIKKEVKEEAGSDIEVERLLAIFDKKFYNHPVSLNYVYKLCFQCRLQSLTFKENIEAKDARFFPADELPALSTRRITSEQMRILHGLAVDANSFTFFD